MICKLELENVFWETFEEDLSHSSDTGQSFNFDCWVEEIFFELLPSDKKKSLEFDLWVEDEYF